MPDYTCRDLAGQTTALPALDAVTVTETWTADALAGRAPKTDRLAWLLRGWRGEVDRQPYPELVTVDDAVAIVLAARARTRRGRGRLWVMPAAAAAGLLVLLAGTAVGSYSATPDDTLWPLTQAIYGEHAHSVGAAYRVELHLAAAKQALATGRSHAAEAELAAALPDLREVRPSDGLAQLADVHEFLAAKAAETPDGTPVDPGTPLIGDPSRPVPLGAQLGAPVVLQVAAAPLVSLPAAGLASGAPTGPPVVVVPGADVAPIPAPGGGVPAGGSAGPAYPAPVTITVRPSTSGTTSAVRTSSTSPVPVESAQATGGGAVEAVVATSEPASSSAPAPTTTVDVPRETSAPSDGGRTDTPTTTTAASQPDPSTTPTTTAPPTISDDPGAGGADQDGRTVETSDVVTTTEVAVPDQSTGGGYSSGGQTDPTAPEDSETPTGNVADSDTTDTTQDSVTTTSNGAGSTGE